MHEVLVNRLGGLSLPRKSVVRLTDRPDMTLDVYRGRKTTIQYNAIQISIHNAIENLFKLSPDEDYLNAEVFCLICSVYEEISFPCP